MSQLLQFRVDELDLVPEAQANAIRTAPRTAQAHRELLSQIPP